MIRRPPRSTLFPYTTSSDLADFLKQTAVRTRGSRPRRGRFKSPRPDRLFQKHQESPSRSEEHTSELQSQSNLVCRLLLEKKKFLPHLQFHHVISNYPQRI